MANDPYSHDHDEAEADFAENALDPATASKAAQPPPALIFFFSYLFPGIFTVIGIGLLIGGAFVLNNAFKTRDWPHTRGMITRSEVDRGNSARVSSSSFRTSTMYSAGVEYTYVVDGQQYRGHNISTGQYSSSDSQAAYKVLKRYPLGEPVEVYYQPGNPANSLLEPGASVVSYILLGIGAVFLAVGLLLYGILPRAFKKRITSHLEKLRQGGV